VLEQLLACGHAVQPYCTLVATHCQELAIWAEGQAVRGVPIVRLEPLQLPA
jgi:hypothetical protein